MHLGSNAMNWKLGQLLYISDWSKLWALGFILDQTHCILAYWISDFLLAIGLTGPSTLPNHYNDIVLVFLAFEYALALLVLAAKRCYQYSGF